MKKWVCLGVFSLFCLAPKAISIDLPSAFKVSKKPPQVTVLEFSDKFCLSCKKLKPELEKLQKKYGHRLKVVYIDVQQKANQVWVQKYGVEVVPVFLIYKKQKTLFKRFNSDLTPSQCRQWIEKAFQ